MDEIHSSTPRTANNPNRPFWALEGFNPRKILPARFWRHTDAIRYIVGRVAVGQAIDARRRQGGQGWVALRREDVWPIFGSMATWNEVRNALLNLKILECDEVAEEGKKAKWYRLGWDWRYHVAVQVMPDRPVVKEKIQAVDERLNDRTCWEPVHYHLDHWLKRTRIDETVAHPWLVGACRIRKRYLTALKVALIQSGLAEIKVDPYGRVHSPVVNLRRVVRPALRIDGHPLVEIDVCGSQPLLTGYLCAKVTAGEWTIADVQGLGEKQEDGARFPGYMHALWGEGGAIPTQPNPKASHTIPVLNLHLSSIIRGLPDDLVEYIRVCEKSDFYGALAATWGRSCEDERTRGQVKRLAFKHMLFGRARPGYRLWELTRRRWPTLIRFLELVKAEDKGVPARACQRLEASLIVGAVATQFGTHDPSVPMQTIHDSLLVPQDAVGVIQAAVVDVFGVLGLRPSLKAKGAA